MDNKEYEWLLADVTWWRGAPDELDDNDLWPRMASILGVYGRLRPVGWVATNDGELGAIWLGTWVSACAKFRVNFAFVLVVVVPKRIRSANGHVSAISSYEKCTSFRLVPVGFGCAKSHAPSQ